MLLALSGLVSLFDFIELLRRSATKPDATFGLVTEIAGLRFPYVTMQILPFADHQALRVYRAFERGICRAVRQAEGRRR